MPRSRRNVVEPGGPEMRLPRRPVDWLKPPVVPESAGIGPKRRGKSLLASNLGVFERFSADFPRGWRVYRAADRPKRPKRTKHPQEARMKWALLGGGYCLIPQLSR